MNILELSEQEIVRRQSLEQMRAIGIDPYPAAEYKVTGHTAEIKENFTDIPVDAEGNPLPDAPAPRRVSVAGRIMGRRIMGKASFMELQDANGRIQVYINRDELCPGENKDLYNVVFKKLLDIGDFVGVEGYVFRTQTGEISIHASSLTVLSKSLRPLPIVKVKDGVTYDGFEDPELRYRRRYVDLVVNEGVKDIFIKRTKVFNSMRNYFNEHGYMEVETPILQSIPGGASARPFITHHNALDIPLYLRIADELYLKRLIVGGFEGVLEELPQRGYGPHSQSRVHLHGDLCLLQGLQLDDELHREDARTHLPRGERHNRGESGRQRHIVQGAFPPRHHARRHPGAHRLRHRRQGRGAAACSRQGDGHRG